MTFLERLLGNIGYVKAESKPPGFLRVAAGHDRYNAPDMSLAENQLSAAQIVAAVAQGVMIPSKYSATVPFGVFQLAGEDKSAVENHPFELLLRKPNSLQSRFQLLESTFAYLLLTGNAYWHLNVIAGQIVELYSLPPNRIKPVPGNTVGFMSHYEWDAGLGETYNIPPDEIVHFAEFHPTNMWVGMSRIEPNSKAVEKDSKAETYDLNYFARDHAKPEAIMTFAGMLDDNNREALKERFERRHGGTKRSLAILDNVEKLDYKQLASTYVDMEFIKNRQFTREQIFGSFAPGLAQILAVNTTEANARTGKATLMEMAIWPMLVAVAETISNKILPLYGENLTGEFEDVRLSDTAMELSEQQEFAKVHTIDEVRAKYYNADPIGDERGQMLIVQVGQTSERYQFASDLVNPVGVPPGENVSVVEAAEDNPDKETAGQEPVKALPAPTELDLIHAELRTWERFVKNRFKAGKALRAFETDYIPAGLRGAIEGALDAVDNAADAALIFTDALRYEGSYGRPAQS